MYRANQQYIETKELSTYFSDLYNRNSSDVSNNSKLPPVLSTVVINTKVIPSTYFVGLKDVEHIYLQNVEEVEDGAFKEIKGVKDVYIPNTLKPSKKLLSDLNDCGVKVYFEATDAKYDGEYEVGIKFEDLYKIH